MRAGRSAAQGAVVWMWSKARIGDLPVVLPGFSEYAEIVVPVKVIKNENEIVPAQESMAQRLLRHGRLCLKSRGQLLKAERSTM